MKTHRSLIIPAALAALLALAGTAAAQAPAAAPEAALTPGAQPDAAVAVPGGCEEGRNLYRSGNFVAARTALKECLADGDESLDVLLPLAVMAVRENRPDEGVQYAGRAVELAPDDAEARYWYGRALLRANRVDEARAQWQEGLQLDLGHQGILEGLARLALREGETAKAYQLLTQMRRQGMDEAWLHRLLADIAASKRLWPEALQHLQDAMNREAPSAADLRGAAELSILAGDKPGAVTFCRRAVALEPSAASVGGLGEAFFAAEQLDSALVYLRRAVDLGGASTRFRFNLANALEVAGQFEAADKEFVNYIQEEPQDPVGHFNYAIHLDKQGREDEALDQVARAIALDPDMLSARVVQVQMLEATGQWDAALAALAELKVRDRSNAADLATWEQRLTAARDSTSDVDREGKVHLLHMVLGDASLLGKVTDALARGENFAELTVRYSRGPAAAKGGDVGWIDPQDMVEPLRTAILKLGINETSPPIESKGLYHLFRRIR